MKHWLRSNAGGRFGSLSSCATQWIRIDVRAHRSKTRSLEDGIDEQKECRNSLKTDGSGIRLERDAEAGTATVATRLVFWLSRISKLTQLRAQSATSRRPKGSRVISTPLVSPELQRNQRQLRYLTIRWRTLNGSRNAKQGDKLSGDRQREEVEMDTAGDSGAFSQHQTAPERLGEIGDLDREK
ncbi:unnamed protein product [Brassica rapa subsp. trilocularis]